MTKKTQSQSVVVTTEHRGVFFGYTEEPHLRPIVLKEARMCLYWSQEIKGVMGLASEGPNSFCRVGPAVPELTLEKVTAVIRTTDKAAQAWEKGPWAK